MDKGGICLPPKTYGMAVKTSRHYRDRLNHSSLSTWPQTDRSGPKVGSKVLVWGPWLEALLNLPQKRK